MVDAGGGSGQLRLVGGALAFLASLLLSCLLQVFTLAGGGLLLTWSVLLLHALVVASVELYGDALWWNGAEADGSRATGCGV